MLSTQRSWRERLVSFCIDILLRIPLFFVSNNYIHYIESMVLFFYVLLGSRHNLFIQVSPSFLFPLECLCKKCHCCCDARPFFSSPTFSFHICPSLICSMLNHHFFLSKHNCSNGDIFFVFTICLKLLEGSLSLSLSLPL